MQKPSQSEIDARWDSLSEDIREVILSEETGSLISSYAAKNNVPGKDMAIRQILNFRLYGFASDEDILSELIKIFGGAVGKNIYDDLVIGILSPIRDYLPKAPEKKEVVITAPSVEAPISAPEDGAPVALKEDSAPARLENIGQVEAAPVIPPEITPIPSPTPVLTPAPAPSPAPETTEGSSPAPFIIHQETDIKPVMESSGTGHWSPLRPSFYIPEIEEMREEKPTFAKLEFGGSAPEPEIVPSAESLKKDVPKNNVVDLRDLPL